MALKLVAIGGLGKMLSPSAIHLMDGQTAHFVRVLDRGGQGDYRQQCREQWRQHRASLVSSLEALVAQGDFDGVVICAGKNGDDYLIIQQLVPLLKAVAKNKSFFVLHLSTVSCDFVSATYAYCAQANIDYVNYPLTGGTLGASKATMLILAAGQQPLYEKLLPMLRKIGMPHYFGDEPANGAAVKLIGHVLVFSGLLGVSLAALLQHLVFPSASSVETTAFFDVLNQGAGGTRQWDVALRQGLQDDNWQTGFMLRHAAIDLIYTLDLMRHKGVPEVLTIGLCELSILFSHLLKSSDNDVLATQAVYRLLATHSNADISEWIRHGLDVSRPFESCLAALPERLKQDVMVTVQY